MEVLNISHVAVPVRADAMGAGFLAVLTEGDANDQAVYVGISGHLGTDSPSYGDTKFAAAVWVMNYGLKLSYRKALAYFPDLKEAEYRD